MDLEQYSFVVPTDETVSEQLTPWQDYLKDLPSPLLIPTDRSRLSVSDQQSQAYIYTLSPDLLQSLRQMSQQQGLPVATLLFTTFQTLVARYIGQQSGVIGSNLGVFEQNISPTSDRKYNILFPVRIDLSGNPPVTMLLERTRTILNEALALQRICLTQQIPPILHDTAHPVFLMAFNWYYLEKGVTRTSEQRTAFARPPNEHIDLSFHIFEEDKDILIRVDYKIDLFDLSTIQRISEHFEHLLAGMITNPHRRLSELPLLTATQWQQMIVNWNASEISVPLQSCFSQLFEEQAARTPDAIAVICQGDSLTYAELNQHANQLAHQLRHYGVGPEVLVGVLLERGIHFIVSLLAIFKAGGAFLPLDRRQPARLHAQMLRHSRSTLVISSSQLHNAAVLLRGELGEHDYLKILHIDQLEQREDWNENLQPCSFPSNLAYVMFTSGSTGLPKGVMVEQQGMINHIVAKIRDLQITSEDRVAQVGPPCFDIIIWQCLAALIVGACVCVVPDAIIEDPIALLEALTEEQITVLQLVPALIRALVQAAQLTRPNLVTLRWLVPTGDALPAELCQQWFHLYPTIPLLNTYGSTECSDDQCHYRIDAFPQENVPSIMPIGTSIGNLKTYILDSFLQPLPVGVPGNLYIGGVGVGRGYLHRPELTAERFIPDPFSTVSSARLYQTGDQARYRTDGTIEFLGRLDFMVKIRGYRIELDEIDAIVHKHPAVLDSVVIAWKEEQAIGDASLVCYLVIKENMEFDEGQLRRFLQDYLPEHMIPGHIIPVETLPLNANGKIDRKSLPRPMLRRPAQKQEYAAPGNLIEQQVVAIWEDVLGQTQIGVHDNFFELGGHSLLAMQVIMRIQALFQVRIVLRTLFDQPTIAELATIIGQRVEAMVQGQHQESTASSTLLEITPTIAQRYDPFPLTDLQQAYWVGQNDFFELGNVSAHIYAEFESFNFDTDLAQQALIRLIERHDILRSFVTTEGLQQVLPEVPPYDVALTDLRGLPLAEQEERLQIVREHMSQHGPRTDRWPLFDIVINQTDENRFHIHISASLLLIDAYTEYLLAYEWLHLYHHLESSLPSQRLSYRDAIVALQHSDQVTMAWNYWKPRLTTLPAAPELPMVHSSQTKQHHRFVRRQARLSAEDWRSLQELARRFDVTPNVVLCTAYAEVLARWSKTQLFTLNVLSSSRLLFHDQVDDIAGNFGSTIPLEIDCRTSQSFMQRCKTVQHQLWNDIEHNQVSGIRLMREVAHAQGWSARAALPIVFASGLNMAALEKQYPLMIKEVSGALQTPQVFLDYQVYERGNELLVVWDAVDELFPEGVIDTMFAANCRALEYLARHERGWHAPLSLIIQSGHITQLPAFSQAMACDEHGLLHTPFLRQAMLRPNHPAVITSERTLSYDELLRRSLRVASWLTEQGAQPNTLVAVMMEKGWEQIVAVLGILEAGAAYLPLDPSLPPARIHALLEHAQVSLVLTQSWIEASFSWPTSIIKRCVDQELPVDDAVTLPEKVQHPHDLAYVIYTSGSTGSPKGVMIDHRSAVNTIADMNQRFQVTPEDRIFALSSLNFDLSVYDIFGSLAAGATIVMPNDAAVKDPAHWAERVAHAAVTIWNSVPALMEMLVDYLEQQSSYSLPLRLVLMSGDWIPVTLPDRIRALRSSVQVISLGGATEASIWSILYPIEQVDPQWTSIPYGKGMLNQDIYVLNETLEPCPSWVTGHLYIGGVGLAKGYWRDEAKTQASFLTHPHAGVPLYKTGDLGRYLPDGTIEFLGREDFQVKVQGYRIELGEIEVAIRKHPAIKDTVVVAQDHEFHGRSLVAYVVPLEGQSITVNALRAHLQAILPAYMVPSVFVVLEHLPLTANGKIDRRALPAPQRSRSSSQTVFLAHSNALEKELTELWEMILVIHPIGIKDNFFDLGGNSFSALRLLSLVKERWGTTLPLSALFQSATVEQMALLLNQQQDAPSSPLVPIRTIGTRLPFFCVHPVGGNVLCYAEVQRLMGDDQPFYGIEAMGLREGHTPHTRIEDMAACYIQAIRTVQKQGPYHLGGWSMGGIIAFEMARQLHVNGEEVATLAVIDSHIPVYAEYLFSLDDTDWLLLFARDLSGKEFFIDRAGLGRGSLEQQFARLHDALTQQGVLLPTLAPEQLDRLLRVFKANNCALATYTAGLYSGEMALFTASTIPTFSSPVQVSAWEHVAAQLAVYPIPGDHYTMLTEPHVHILVKHLTCLLGNQ